MHHFHYRNGVLHAEDVDIGRLAEAVGTPFYCYSTATLERHYRVFTEAFAGLDTLVCYAMKANSNQSVLRTLARLGAGADVAWIDALREGFSPGTISLTGGISRNPLYAQIFANALGLPVTVNETEEAAAWGAALCAGAGAGLYASPTQDPRDLAALARHYQPDPTRSQQLQERYALHCDIATQLAPLWPRIEALASQAA